MKALLSAATFGLLPSPLPSAIDPDGRQTAGLAGRQSRPGTKTTESEPDEEEGRMRCRSEKPRRPRFVAAGAGEG